MATQHARGGRVAMAAYLRSVVGRASEHRAPSPSDNQQNGDQQESSDDLKGDENIEGKTDIAAILGGCDTASSTGTLEDRVESHDVEEPPFSVRIELSRSMSQHSDTKEGRRNAVIDWAYCDVLLQPDAYGLGLNLSESCAPKDLIWTHDDKSTTATVVVVASFRRLHVEDLGPAEASREIQSGDILWSIEGERITTLEMVAAIMARHTNQFILLRFLRPTDASESNATNKWAEAVGAFGMDGMRNGELRPDVAVLIRELVTRNQSLEEQLLASRLKQDEQRIQLDQLHALYAKTQLDNWSAFSLPKRFTRRGTNTFTRDAPSLAAGTTRPAAALSSAAARLMGTNNLMQYDVEFAVHAERERLTQQFQQQLETQQHELQVAHTTQLEAMRAAADKKIRMMEHGITELLISSAPRDDCESATPVEVSPYVLALRHQLLHHQSMEEDKTMRRDCILCLLENECTADSRQQTDNDDAQEGWRYQVGSILDEYAAHKATRELLLRDPVSINEQVHIDGDHIATMKPPPEC